MPSLGHFEIPVHQPVHVRRSHDREIVLQRDLKRLFGDHGLVDDFDAVQQLLVDEHSMHRAQFRDAVGCLRRPHRVIPENERSLAASFSERFECVVVQQTVGVLDEDRVRVARRHAPRDLGAVDDEQIVLARVLKRELVRPVAIRVGDVVFVRLILQMLGQRDSVETVSDRLLDADVRLNGAIGEHGMLVKIALQSQIIRHIGKLDAPLFLSGSTDGDEDDPCDEQRSLFHGT